MKKKSVQVKSVLFKKKEKYAENCKALCYIDKENTNVWQLFPTSKDNKRNVCTMQNSSVDLCSSYRLFWKMLPLPIPPRPRPLAATAQETSISTLINQRHWHETIETINIVSIWSDRKVEGQIQNTSLLRHIHFSSGHTPWALRMAALPLPAPDPWFLFFMLFNMGAFFNMSGRMRKRILLPRM